MATMFALHREHSGLVRGGMECTGVCPKRPPRRRTDKYLEAPHDGPACYMRPLCTREARHGGVRLPV